MPTGVSDAQQRDDEEAIKALALLGGFFLVASAIGYLATVSWKPAIPRDATTLVIGRDFLNYWMYGRVASLPDPGRFFDLATYNQLLSTIVGAGYPGQNLPNPPSFMLLAWPFGPLGYIPALIVWTALGLGVFLKVAGARLPDRRLLLALIASPA